MILIIPVLIFAIHACIFFRQYLRNKRQFYFLVTSMGFVLLTVFYGYREFDQYFHLTSYAEWARYLRFSGIALCAASLPILVKRIYFWFILRFAHRTQA